MSEARDPAIKLFGRTIPLAERRPPADGGGKSDPVIVVETDDEKVCSLIPLYSNLLMLMNK